MSANSKGTGETGLMRRLPEPLLVAYVISNLFSCAGSIHHFVDISEDLLRMSV